MRATGGFGRRSATAETAAAATLQPVGMRRALAATGTQAVSVSPAAEAADETDVLSRIGGPILTSLLLLAMIAVFWAEQQYPVSAGHGLDPSLRTIVALGAASRDLVIDKGEWWRLFTAPLLHGGLSHIIGNAIAFFFAALCLEKMVGRSWLAALFFLGALGGVTGSLISNPPELVTVGASGAIMCLLSALVVLSLDSNVVKNPGRIQRIALFLLIPSLAPAAAGEHIDIAAHLGGTAVGTVLGFLIQITWSEEKDTPSLKGLALGIGVAGAAAALLSFQLVASHYGVSSANAASIPELQVMSPEDFPTDAKEADKKSAEYVEKFPDDPRAHFFRALYYMRGYDMTSAQGELRIAMSEKAVLEQLPSEFTAMIRVMLAATLVQQGRIDDARREAGSACAEAENDGQLTQIMEQLKQRGICRTAD